MSRNNLILRLEELQQAVDAEISICGAEIGIEPGDAQVNVSFRAERCGGEIVIAGRVVVSCSATCHLCLEPTELSVNEPFCRSEPWGPEDIDLLPDVRDAFMAGVPMKSKCAPDCRGLCPSCGANLNKEKCSCLARLEGNGLKEILKEALD